jgi:hypothetical protein
MSASTPGPWKWRADYKGLDGPGGSVIIQHYDYEGMHVPIWDGEWAVANARLIEASPDLLLNGKHLAVKLAEVYRASGVNPAKCQAICDWMATVDKVEGKA